MATLTLISSAEQTAHRRADLPLLPVAADVSAGNGARALTTSQRFPTTGAFVPGDQVVVCSTAAFHVLATTVAGAVTTSEPAFPAGAYHMTIPDGCTHVAMLDTAAGAGKGQAYLG